MQEAIKHIGQNKQSLLTTVREKMRTSSYSDKNISAYTRVIKGYKINSPDDRTANIAVISSEKQHIVAA